jgi:hypothetical protein
MPLEKTLLSLVLGVTALSAQTGAPEPAKLSARDLFYAAAPAGNQKAPAKAAKHASSPKKAVPASEAPTTTTAAPPAAPAPAERAAVPPPVLSGGAQILQAAYVGKPLGLRYSILRNNGSDDYREVAADTVFHSGDRIRVAVEANDAGYLYVAMKGASGAWKILFPTAEIAGGNNRVESGRQCTIPSPPGRFAFDQQPGEEKLFIVLSRQPEPNLEQLIYSLGSGSAPPDGAAPQPSGRTMMAQAGPLGDPLVSRLRGEVYARDLVFETVDDSTPGEKKENAVYVLNRTGSPDSRLVADFVLKHQ